jgi:hypothetical protein
LNSNTFKRFFWSWDWKTGIEGLDIDELEKLSGLMRKLGGFITDRCPDNSENPIISIDPKD